MPTFSAILEQEGKTATGIEVPPEIMEALGGGKKPAVTVTLNGYAYRSTVGVMGGRSMIPVSAGHRGNAGLSAGESVQVMLELDTAPREVDVPEDLQAALDANPAALAAFATTGNVWWQYMIPMAVANVLGSAAGTRMALARGTGFIRIVFVLVVAGLILKTACDAYAG